jgi:hypothetical protein
MNARRWPVLLGYGAAHLFRDYGILFRNTAAAKLCKTSSPNCPRNRREGLDEYPVNFANPMYMCHLQDLRACGLATAFFPSLFAPKDRVALSTAFSTEIEPSVFASKSKISFTSHSYYWGFRRGYQRVTAEVFLKPQIACGPRNTRIGRNKIARNSSKTPVTAIPTIRNGSSNSHTNG